MTPDQQHCLALLREADRDRYLSVLFAPAEKRGALAALYAFNVETARVRDLIHEPLPGEIRLQWWRDALGARAGAATGHPVADALREAMEAYRLPMTAFDRMLEARIFDLYDDPMPDRAALEAWCGETASTLIQLAALILDATQAPVLADACGHGGCAQAIAGLQLLLPLHRRRGQCFIPLDLLAAAGTSREALIAGEPGARAAVEAMTALGREHLTRFEAAARGLPPAVRPAFLPLAPVRARLDAIAASADPLDAPGKPGALRVQWLAWRRALSGW